MKRVCAFYWNAVPSVEGAEIVLFDPLPFLGERESLTLRDLLADGWNGYRKRRAMFSGAGIDKLYRRRDPTYMRLINEFVDRFRNFDLIILAHNFLHPDVLQTALARPAKVLGFIDDPYSTFQRGTPFLWAFDGAFHISPSYNEHWLFSEAFDRWHCSNHKWWPLTQPLDLPERGEEFFQGRDVDLVYVGNPHPNKLGRLASLKKKYGSRFRVHGRWRCRGLAGWAGLLSGHPVFPYRVTPLTADERTQLYRRAKIGFNMHVSEVPTESGNMRMYELPSYGVMQVCDKAGRDAHATIFAPGREAVFYDDMKDAIDRIDYYLAHPAERVAIAQAAYRRVRLDYDHDRNFAALIHWGLGLKAADKRAPDGCR